MKNVNKNRNVKWIDSTTTIYTSFFRWRCNEIINFIFYMWTVIPNINKTFTIDLLMPKKPLYNESYIDTFHKVTTMYLCFLISYAFIHAFHWQCAEIVDTNAGKTVFFCLGLVKYQIDTLITTIIILSNCYQ